MCDEIIKIKNVLRECLSENSNMIPYLYRLNRSNEGTACSKFQLNIVGDTYKEYLNDLKNSYCGENENDTECILNNFENVSKYDGSDLEYTIWHNRKEDPQIQDVLTALDNSTLYCEKNWTKNYKALKDAKGLMLEWKIEGKTVTLILASASLKELKHSFLFLDGKFKVAKGDLITLPNRIDIIRIEDDVYILTKQGLSIILSLKFLKENTKNVLNKDDVKNKIANFDEFSKLALTFNNQRRMLRFNKEKLEKIANNEDGKELRKKFNIQFSKGKLVVKTQKEVDSLIKVICDRGMVDPFNEDAMEVAGSQKWKG